MYILYVIYYSIYKALFIYYKNNFYINNIFYINHFFSMAGKITLFLYKSLFIIFIYDFPKHSEKESFKTTL